PPVQDASISAELLGPSKDNGVALTDLFPHSDSINARSRRPFTCLRVGPFPEPNVWYVMRLEAMIEGRGSTYSDLIDEEPSRATRVYEVYGPHWVRHHIEFVDLPAAVASGLGQEYESDRQFFVRSILKGGLLRLVPAFYSVIAIDNPNSQPSHLSCVSIDSSAIAVITDCISDGIYDHPFFRGLPPDSVHWFVSGSRAKDFVLQFYGPMRLDEPSTTQLALKGV
ncbi:MAG TPA: hypothetical protein VNA25_09370, partial [Phycisphaerae bacterium]|nr:hypothetical protein [Phycisphaerae bacterium]